MRKLYSMWLKEMNEQAPLSWIGLGMFIWGIVVLFSH